MAMKPDIRAVLGVGALAVALATPWRSLVAAGPTLPWSVYLQILFATGFLALFLISTAMILALRNPWIERRVCGLDQCYRLHRQTAEWGVGFALAHYIVKLGAKELRHGGLLIKPEGFDSGIPDAFAPLHHVAKLAGEWGLYAVVALVAVALIRAIPYHLFARLHRILPLVYLGFVLHGVVFMPLPYWANLAGALFVIAAATGLFVCGASLFGRIGRRRRVQGRVAEITPLGHDVLEIWVDLGPAWPGHEAGQFAFFTFEPGEGAHPFTLASAWAGGNRRRGRVRIAVKALGDYTSTLPDRLEPGAPVRVEGPYGHFSFDQGKGRQIWIAGGIGLTPFVARLEHRAADRAARAPVDLFYTTRGASEAILTRLTALAELGAVRLHVVDTGREAPVDAAAIARKAPDWKTASVWFCGPARFGDALEADFIAMGAPEGRFHREAFEFR